MITLINAPNGESPFFYAALEEWSVRNCDCNDTDFLLLYVNESCAVIGKNQCVYRELNFNFWFNQSEKVVRRVSGGGAVFHDSGNLNFTFISKFEEWKINNYRHFNEAVKRYLIQQNIPATYSDRNDMLADGKKISGNAQFTDRKNILSHGTLLVNADLKSLGAALKQNTFEVHTKAVSSVRSEVTNLSLFNSEIDSAILLKQKLADVLCAEVYKLSEAEIMQIKQLQKEKYESYEWRFARSPDCEIVTADFKLGVENGLIKTVAISKEKFQFLSKLKGVSFDKNSISKKLKLDELDIFIHLFSA